MSQVINGLLYLHSHGILHRDLTLANLLLTKDMNVVSMTVLFDLCTSYTIQKNEVYKTFILE